MFRFIHIVKMIRNHQKITGRWHRMIRSLGIQIIHRIIYCILLVQHIICQHSNVYIFILSEFFPQLYIQKMPCLIYSLSFLIHVKSPCIARRDKPPFPKNPTSVNIYIFIKILRTSGCRIPGISIVRIGRQIKIFSDIFVFIFSRKPAE